MEISRSGRVRKIWQREVFDFGDEDKSDESDSNGGQEDYKPDSDEEDFGSQSLKVDRPFQCTECDAAFKRSDHLKRAASEKDPSKAIHFLKAISSAWLISPQLHEDRVFLCHFGVSKSSFGVGGARSHKLQFRTIVNFKV